MSDTRSSTPDYTTADTATYDNDAFSSEPSEISFASTQINVQPVDAISWPCMCSTHCLKIMYLDEK